MSRVQQGQGLSWTTADLAMVYQDQSHGLARRAFRYLRDEQQAQDVVQEAFIRLMLAAPELNDLAHLHAYLRTTVTNLCLDIRRSQGRGPLLVAVDADTSESALNELAADQHVDFDHALMAADDAAIVREAISRLSQSDRTILLAHEIEQKSHLEIAAEYGITEGSARNALMRARRNLRTLLEEWIIDEETGLTAAQLLSRSYNKVAENSKKIGGAALSLILLVSAFFGFWNNPTTTPAQMASPKVVKTSPQAEGTTPATTPTPSATLSATPTPEELEKWAVNYLAKVGPLGWPGLNSEGLPDGFTVNNGEKFSGFGLISQGGFVMDADAGQVSSDSRFTTFQDGLNVIIGQRVTNSAGKISYSAEPIVRVGGAWIALDIKSTSTEIKRLADGTYLITSWMVVDIASSATNKRIAGYGSGTDLARIPAVIATRLHTTEIGQVIFGQAVQILDPLVGQ